MLLRPILALIILLSLVSASFALAGKPVSSCPNVNLSAQFGLPRNQYFNEVCYAMVAADLIGFAQQLPGNESVSALDVATTYVTADRAKVAEKLRTTINRSMLASETSIKEYKNRIDLKLAGAPTEALYAGAIDTAVASYQTLPGLCKEKQLPSQLSDLNPEASRYLSWKIDSLSKGISADSSSIGSSPEDEIDLALPYVDPEKTSKLITTKKVSAKNQLQDCDQFKDVNSQAKELAKQTSELAFRTIAEQVNKECSPRSPMKEMMTEIDNLKNPSFNAIKTIKAALSNNQPIGISFDASFLTGGPQAPKNHDYGHAAIIVGSRTKNGKCELLLRNSLGTNCEDANYSKKIIKTKACVQGNIWIPEADFAERISATTLVRAK